MATILRPLTDADAADMRHFLYLAIHVPEGEAEPPLSILDTPELAVYYRDFGGYRADCGFVAVDGEKTVGMAWARIMDDYGHVDDETPSLAISVEPEWRGQGIGTALMKALIKALKARAYRRTSLSVQTDNRAKHLYERLGFTTVQERGHEAIMVREL
ncbi:MAG: GNAT family N-acetyltransferase [Clostridiales bacterium]|nr:GNAT family N-acetyltransferase [Clostridiales bacterium]